MAVHCHLNFKIINLQSLGFFQTYKGNIKIPSPQEPILIFQPDLGIQGPTFAQWKHKLFSISSPLEMHIVIIFFFPLSRQTFSLFIGKDIRHH